MEASCRKVVSHRHIASYHVWAYITAHLNMFFQTCVFGLLRGSEARWNEGVLGQTFLARVAQNRARTATPVWLSTLLKLWYRATQLNNTIRTVILRAQWRMCASKHIYIYIYIDLLSGSEAHTSSDIERRGNSRARERTHTHTIYGLGIMPS